MRHFITVLLATLLISGCAKDGKLISSNIPNSCGSIGHTFTWIKYGDSHLGALAFSDIGRNAEWRFRLIPDRSSGPNAYTDAVVTISGKTPADAWVSVSGQHSSNPVLIICVPAALTIGAEVNYMIDVQWVGELDPRAEVVR
jgi:hypothetical protein